MEPGTRLGPYEILEPLGKGGMGEVYRARDPSLKRDVAIKVLPETVAADREQIARLKREAHSLAALSHPNVATIYSLEEIDGTVFLVLEVVEGETLAERLRTGPLPVEDALELAIQIAEGLEAAHERGIIHRDLKPANIKITLEGQVKVLDFGLARPSDRGGRRIDPSETPTATVAPTETGVLMGTAGYMSPEQVRQQALDERTDIWSFGCVLYEMLTGQRAFVRETVSDTLAAILEHEPDWEALPEELPYLVRHLLRRCLNKDPRRRLHHIADVRVELEEAVRWGEGIEQEVGGARSRSATSRLPLWALGGVALLFLAGLIGWALSRPASPAPTPARFQFQPPPGVSLVFAGAADKLAISPDGKWIAFRGAGEGATGTYLRSIEELEAVHVPNVGGTSFSFSPDSRWLAIAGNWDLQKVPVSEGGTPLPICTSESKILGSSWGEDDTILFGTTDGGLFRCSAAGGAPVALTEIDSEREVSHRWPHHLPGGEAALFTVFRGGVTSNQQIAVAALDTGEYRVLPLEGIYPRYAPTGHLVYSWRGALFAAPFDLDELEITGEPEPVLEGVHNNLLTGFASFAVSQTGSLVYLPGASQPAEGQLIWLDREGETGPLIDATRRFGAGRPALSPPGDRLAVYVSDQPEQSSLWVYEFARDNWRRLATAGPPDNPVLWSPDGEWLYFNAREPRGPKIARVRADGRGEPEVLTGGKSWDRPWDLSPDGAELVYVKYENYEWEIWTLPVDANGAAEGLITVGVYKDYPSLSPDGRWIAYESGESGIHDVYVRSYPGLGPGTKISPRGGHQPVWSPDGTELFYTTAGGLWVVPVETGAEFRAGRARILFEDFPAGQFTVSPDGQRFYMVQREGGTQRESGLVYVQNWSTELRRRVPPGR